MKVKPKQAGASLIEILVAIVVLSLGILGFSALQITGLATNKIAMDRSYASILAYNILDSMRSNKAAALAENYDRALGAEKPTGTAIAEKDVAAWLTAIDDALPSGDGAIDVTAANGQVTITIQWNESKNETNSSFSISSRL